MAPARGRRQPGADPPRPGMGAAPGPPPGQWQRQRRGREGGDGKRGSRASWGRAVTGRGWRGT